MARGKDTSARMDSFALWQVPGCVEFRTVGIGRLWRRNVGESSCSDTESSLGDQENECLMILGVTRLLVVLQRTGTDTDTAIPVTGAVVYRTDRMSSV